MNALPNTRWRNTSGYEKFNCPMRSIAVAMLSVAFVDYARLGVKRHRQRCRTGRDWVRHIPQKGKDYVPPIYRDIRRKTEWLYSWQFGLIADIIDRDVEQLREIFLLLMVGPVDA